MREVVAHLLVGVSVAWVFTITVLCILYAFGWRFDD